MPGLSSTWVYPQTSTVLPWFRIGKTSALDPTGTLQMTRGVHPILTVLTLLFERIHHRKLSSKSRFLQISSRFHQNHQMLLPIHQIHPVFIIPIPKTHGSPWITFSRQMHLLQKHHSSNFEVCPYGALVPKDQLHGAVAWTMASVAMNFSWTTCYTIWMPIYSIYICVWIYMCVCICGYVYIYICVCVCGYVYYIYVTYWQNFADIYASHWLSTIPTKGSKTSARIGAVSCRYCLHPTEELSQMFDLCFSRRVVPTNDLWI